MNPAYTLVFSLITSKLTVHDTHCRHAHPAHGSGFASHDLQAQRLDDAVIEALDISDANARGLTLVSCACARKLAVEVAS